MLPTTYQQYLSLKKKNNTLSHSHIQKQRKNTKRDNERFIQLNQHKEQQPKEDEYDYGKPLIQIQEQLIYSDYQKIRNQFNDEKFNAIKQKIEETLKKTGLQTIIPPVDIHKFTKQLQIQSLESLEILECQFAKLKGNRDLHKIDNILHINKFFMIFHKDKRFKIYESSELIMLEKNVEVYKQGQQGEHLYVIIKGSVNILETKQTSYNEKIVVQFNSLYEGAHFGQASVSEQPRDMNNKENRENTIKTTEKTYLLKLKNAFYKELITNSIQDDFQKKLQLIGSIDILKQQSKLFITPLVSSLVKVRYRLGEIVIRKDQIVDSLYIVAQGELQVLLQQRSRRKISSSNIQPEDKRFVYMQFSKHKPHKKNVFAKTFYFGAQQNEKSMLYGNKKLVGDQIEFTNHIVFKELKTGSFFGARTFYTEIYREQKQKNFPKYVFDQKSKLHIVVNSLKAVIYQIQKKKFSSLPDNLQKVILQGLAKTKQYDDAEIEQKKIQQKKWKEYSSKLVEDILKEKREKKKYL